MSKEVFDIVQSYNDDLQEAYENGELMDYINDHALDIEYRASSDLSYLGVEIAIALGGPSVYINTRDNRLEAYWGGDTAYSLLDSGVREELDINIMQALEREADFSGQSMSKQDYIKARLNTLADSVCPWTPKSEDSSDFNLWGISSDCRTATESPDEKSSLEKLIDLFIFHLIKTFPVD